MRWTVTAVAAFAAALLSAGAAAGDTFAMKDGKQIQGKIVKEIGVSWIQIRTDEGKLLTVKRFDIVRHVKGDRPVPKQDDAQPAESGTRLEEYRRRAEAVKDPNAEAHYKLGKWCKANGLVKTSRKEFEKALEQDENHEGARLALGYKLAIIDGKKVWLKPDEAKVYEAERRFLAEAGARKSAWGKAVGVSYAVSLEKPKGDDKKTMSALEVRDTLVVKYKLTNRTPFTLVVGGGARGRRRPSTEKIAPGKTGRGEWRTWMYATSADQPDRSTWGRGSSHRVQAHRMGRTTIRARLEGKYARPKVSLAVELSYRIVGTRYYRRKATAKEIAKFLKVEVTPLVGAGASENRRRIRRGEKAEKGKKEGKGEKGGKGEKDGEGEKEE